MELLIAPPELIPPSLRFSTLCQFPFVLASGVDALSACPLAQRAPFTSHFSRDRQALVKESVPESVPALPPD
jgi:hypothetical protein